MVGAANQYYFLVKMLNPTLQGAKGGPREITSRKGKVGRQQSLLFVIDCDAFGFLAFGVGGG